MVIVVVKNLGSSNESLGKNYKKYNIIDAFALRSAEGEKCEAIRSLLVISVILIDKVAVLIFFKTIFVTFDISRTFYENGIMR